MPITDLKPNTIYEYRVAGFTSKGRGDFSPVREVMTEPLMPPKPRNFKVTLEKVEGLTAIRVKWHLPENHKVDKYK